MRDDETVQQSKKVRYKTRTGPGLVLKRGPGLGIKHGLMDCMYAMIIGLLSLMLAAVGQNNKYNPSLWHHSIVWRLFGDKKTSKSHET